MNLQTEKRQEKKNRVVGEGGAERGNPEARGSGGCSPQTEVDLTEPSHTKN